MFAFNAELVLHKLTNSPNLAPSLVKNTNGIVRRKPSMLVMQN
jgi:hypothetical protein